MKKLVLILTVLILSLGLIGCDMNGDDDNGDKNGNGVVSGEVPVNLRGTYTRVHFLTSELIEEDTLVLTSNTIQFIRGNPVSVTYRSSNNFQELLMEGQGPVGTFQHFTGIGDGLRIDFGGTQSLYSGLSGDTSWKRTGN